MTRSELIAALERATGPNYDLDALIWNAIGRPDTRTHDGTPCVLTYTASIDAAMTLVPEGWAIERIQIWPGQRPYVSLWECGQDRDGKWWHSAGAKKNHQRLDVDGATPAIALCIAALKAMEATDD